MRPIKFRGKRKDNGEWVYGYLMQMHSPERLFIGEWVNLSNEARIKDELFSSYKEVIPETVGQFTGLHDKNGVEIYEGDLVLVKNGIATDGTYKAKVLWFDEGCQWITQTIESDTGEWDVMQPQECGGFYEVIGNIHERSKT